MADGEEKIVPGSSVEVPIEVESTGPIEVESDLDKPFADEVNIFNSLMSKFNNNVTTGESNNGLIKNKLIKLQIDINNLSDILNELKDAQIRNEAEIERLNDLLRDLTNEKERLSESLNDQLKNQAEDLNSVKETLTQKDRLHAEAITQQIAFNTKTQEDLANAESEAATLKSELDKTKEQQLLIIKHSHDKEILLNREIADLQSGKDNLTEQNEALNGKIIESQNALASLTSETNADKAVLDKQIADLQSGKNILTEQNEALNGKIIESQNALASLTSQTDADKALLDSQIAELQSGKDNLIEQNKALSGRITESQNALASLTSQTDADKALLDSQIAELQRSLNELQQESNDLIDALRKNNENLQSEIASLSAEASTNSTELNNALAALQTSTQSVASTLSELTACTELKEASYAEARRLNEQLKKQLNIIQKINEYLGKLQVAETTNNNDDNTIIELLDNMSVQVKELEDVATEKVDKTAPPAGSLSTNNLLSNALTEAQKAAKEKFTRKNEGSVVIKTGNGDKSSVGKLQFRKIIDPTASMKKKTYVSADKNLQLMEDDITTPVNQGETPEIVAQRYKDQALNINESGLSREDNVKKRVEKISVINQILDKINYRDRSVKPEKNDTEGVNIASAKAATVNGPVLSTTGKRFDDLDNDLYNDFTGEVANEGDNLKLPVPEPNVSNNTGGKSKRRPTHKPTRRPNRKTKRRNAKNLRTKRKPKRRKTKRR